MENQTETTQIIHPHRSWYDKNYRLLMLIPFLLIISSLIYLSMFYSSHGSLFYQDVSLSGGTVITLKGDFDSNPLKEALKSEFNDVSFRELTDITSGKQLALIIESTSQSEILTQAVEKNLGYNLTEENSSVEFTGSTLSESFAKQLLVALLMSFVLMSIVIFVMFRSFIPSIAVIFSAFANMVLPLVLINILGIKLSIAGIAAFLMIIGYSVDTNILLTKRAITPGDKPLNSRIFGAFKTGTLMIGAALAAVLPAFFFFQGLPDTFRQIFLIMALGLFFDIINTWMMNAGIIKWYCDRKGIK